MLTPDIIPSGIDDILAEARQRDVEPQIVERLEWLAHYRQYRSVSHTCRTFGIARTTFYRWLKRFNPADLSSLSDHPKTGVHQYNAFTPRIPIEQPKEVTPPKMGWLLLSSIAVHAIIILSLVIVLTQSNTQQDTVQAKLVDVSDVLHSAAHEQTELELVSCSQDHTTEDATHVTCKFSVTDEQTQ